MISESDITRKIFPLKPDLSVNLEIYFQSATAMVMGIYSNGLISCMWCHLQKSPKDLQTLKTFHNEALNKNIVLHVKRSQKQIAT